MTNANLEDHQRTAHQGLAPSRRTERQISGISDEPARKHQVSILTRLTGAGYEEESGRHISCLVLGCSHRFLREYDLDTHLQSHHGLADLEVRNIPMDQEGLYSGQALQGASVSAAEQVFDAEKGLGVHPNDDVGAIVHEETPGAPASKGGAFWPKDRSYQGKGDSGEWFRDEVEMRQLTDGGISMQRYETVDGQEVDVIDPVLV